MVVHPPPILSKIFMHLPSPPCPYFTPTEAIFPSSPLILSHTSSPLSCAHSSLMHAWPPPIVAIHQHIPILSNLHTYPCTSPPSYPCKLSTFVYPSPHIHANLPCSHTLSNMHGHPPMDTFTHHPFLTRPSLTFNTQLPHFLSLHIFSLYTTPHTHYHLFSLYTTPCIHYSHTRKKPCLSLYVKHL